MPSVESKAVLSKWPKSKHGQNLTTSQDRFKVWERRKCLKSLLHSQCGKCLNHTAPGKVKLTLNVSGIFNAFIRDLANPSPTKSQAASLLSVGFLNALKVLSVALTCFAFNFKLLLNHILHA